MCIEFPIDNKLLGDLLYSLVKSNLEPRFEVWYSIFDTEKERYKESLIESSVENARKRAGILAKSADVCLGEIITIDYSEKTIDFYNNMWDCNEGVMPAPSAVDDTYNLDIEAEDMTISDSVNMTWEIK